MKSCCEQHNQEHNQENQENKKGGSGWIILAVGTIITVIVLIVVFSSKSGQNAGQGAQNNTVSAGAAVADQDHDSHHSGGAAPGSSGSLADLIDKPAPAFSFADRQGNIYTSDNLKGKNTVLFFNEGLMCYPACWNQIVSFSQDARFAQNNAAVISVVVDPPEDWQAAVEKMPELAAATVVFDKNAAASNAYGVLNLPSSMHRGAFPGHTYVVIDADGIIKYAFDDPNMGINNDKVIEVIAKTANT